MRLVDEAGRRRDRLPPARGRHPAQGRRPTTRWRASWSSAIDGPVIISGGLDTAEAARRAYEESGAAAVMIARGSLGNPWIFEELTGRAGRAADRERDRRRAALGDRPRRGAHGPRARRPLPAQVLPVVPRAARGRPRELAAALQRSDELDRPGDLIGGLAPPRRPPRERRSSPTRVEAWRERGEDEDFGGRRIHVFRRDGRGAAAAAPARLPVQLV